MRNPAALIHHQMILDLIENEEVDFDEAFVNDDSPLMPMAMSEATSMAIALNNYYYEKGIPYRYDSRQDSSYKRILLIQAEKELELRWLEMKRKREDIDENDNLETALENAIQGWYGIDITSLV